MMMNPLKDFLKPKYVVGLQVKDGFIGAVQLYVGLKGPEIDKAVFREVADPERIQEELKKLFQEEGFKKEMIVTSHTELQSLYPGDLPAPFSTQEDRKDHQVSDGTLSPLPCGGRAG